MRSEWNYGKVWRFSNFTVRFMTDREPMWGGVRWPTVNTSHHVGATRELFQVNFHVKNITVSIRFETLRRKIP